MSPIFGPVGDENWTDPDYVTLGGGAIANHSRIVLAKHDLSPNRNWRHIGRDGTPRAWDINLPPGREGAHIYISRPGNRTPGVDVPDEETEPPRRDTLTKQTRTPMDLGKAWATHAELDYGESPELRDEHISVLPAPLTGPSLNTYASTSKGFPSGVYGVAVDLRRRRRGGRTTTSAFTSITLTANQGFRVYVPPEAASSGAEYMGVLITRPGTSGNQATAKEQAVFKLDDVGPDGYVEVEGPYHDGAWRPATLDESGIGTPEVPYFERRYGSAYVEQGRARGNLRNGTYRFGYYVETESGLSLLSELTKEFTVTHPTRDYRRDAALWFYFPGVPDEWNVIPAVYYKPPIGGTGQWYSVTRAVGTSSEGTAFTPEELEDGIAIYGPLEDQVEVMEHELIRRGRPPTSDYSSLRRPPRSDGPNVVAYSINPLDAPATYLIASTDEDESGNETDLSPTGTLVLTASTQGIQAHPAPPTNQIPNAEGAHRDAAGNILYWTNMGTGATSTATFVDGSLLINGTGSGTSLAPQTAMIQIPDATTPVAIKGQLRMGRQSAAAATEMVVRFYEASGAQVGTDTVILSSNVTGKINTGELGTMFGPTGTARPDGTTQMRLIFRGVGSSWNAAAYFENLGVFFQESALRKFDKVGLNKPVIFNPTAGSVGTSAGAAAPYPSGSTHAVGPVQAAEENPPAAEPFVEIVNFTGGVWPGSGATAWSTTPFTNTATEAVETTGAIFDTYSVRHQDATTSTIKSYRRRRTYTDLEMSNSPNLYFRFYDRITTLPTTGEVDRVTIRSHAGNAMATLSYTATTLRLWTYRNGSKYGRATVLYGLVSGMDLDVEIGVKGQTSNEQVEVSVGTNGNARTKILTQTGTAISDSWTTWKPRQVDFGILETSAGATPNFRADNLITSIGGAPLNYETQPPPSGGTTVPATMPAPDSPTLSGGGYRLYDYNNQALNQWWFWIEPEVERTVGVDYGPFTEEHINVREGQTITQAIQGAYTLHEVPEEPSHQFFVTLFGPDVEPLEVGSPFAAGRDAALVSRSGGARMDNAVDVGMSSSAAHASDDFYQIFTVPEGYLWATVSAKYGAGGYYVFQEHLWALGSLTTQVARDAMRDYERHATGTVSVAIPAMYERNPYNWATLDVPLRIDVEPSLPGPGATITDLNFQSGPSPSGPWSPAVTDAEDVPQGTYYLVNFTMNGEEPLDGDSPVIGPGSLYVIVKPFTSQLLKRDRTEIAGPIVVNGMDTPAWRPRTEVMELDGDVFAARRSKRVRYLERPITLLVTTEDAKRYLERHLPDQKLTIEAPFLRGPNQKVNAKGRVVVIKPGQNLVVQTNLASAYIEEEGNERNVYGICTIENAQVIEYAPLQND